MSTITSIRSTVLFVFVLFNTYYCCRFIVLLSGGGVGTGLGVVDPVVVEVVAAEVVVVALVVVVVVVVVVGLVVVVEGAPVVP